MSVVTDTTNDENGVGLSVSLVADGVAPKMDYRLRGNDGVGVLRWLFSEENEGGQPQGLPLRWVCRGIVPYQ